MTEGHHCPVEGCDYGSDEAKDFGQVRTHIAAKADDDHDWQALQEVVEQQAEGADDTDDDGDEQNEHPESGDGERESSSEPSTDEHPESKEGDNSMSTDEEVQEQWSGESSSESSSDDQPESGNSERETSTQSSSENGGIPLSLIGYGGVALGAGWLVYQYATDDEHRESGVGKGESSSEPSTDEQTPEPPETGGGDGLLEGGSGDDLEMIE